MVLDRVFFLFVTAHWNHVDFVYCGAREQISPSAEKSIPVTYISVNAGSSITHTMIHKIQFMWTGRQSVGHQQLQRGKFEGGSGESLH